MPVPFQIAYSSRHNRTDNAHWVIAPVIYFLRTKINDPGTNMSLPSYASADGYISEQFFTLHFNLILDAAHPPPLSAFAVQINGTGVTVSGVSVDSAAQTIALTFAANALTAGDIIEFAYTDPTGANDVNAIQGLDGLDVATFSSSTVVFGGRPGPSAPPVPTLSVASDSGVAGDGITNVAAPTLSGTAAANAVVKLYDTDGTTLLGTVSADGAGNWSVTSSGLSEGVHTLRVTQTDASNAVSPLSAGLSVTIDTAAAAPTGLAVAAGSDSGAPGDGISNAGTPVITGNAEANATVRLYDTDGSTVLGSATANNLGNWSITSSALIEGAHTLTARQTDVAGNVSGASSGFTYLHDTIGPVGMALSATSVPQTSATNGATIATLSSTDLTAVSYGFQVGNGVIDADNERFSIAGNALVATQNLGAGDYHIYVSGTDAAGNAAYQVFTITVVNGPSVTAIVRAAPASTAPASTASVAYTVTFDQNVTGVDASDFALTATGSASGAIASVSGSGSAYIVTVNGLAGDGTLRLDLNSSATGIQNSTSNAILGGYTAGQSYTVDHTVPAAPSVPFLIAASDSGSSQTDHITSVTTPTFTGSAEANASVTLYDSDGTTVLGTATADGAGNWSITSSLLAAGNHTVSAKAVDAAGNVSAASGALALVIATSAAPLAAPILALASDSGAAGDGITRVVTPTVTGTAAAGAAITLYDTNGSTVLGTATADLSGNWSITSSSLADGSHTLTAKQLDLAGNMSAAGAGLVLSIDAQAPAAPSALGLAPASDSGVLGDNSTVVAVPVIRGTGEANATVSLYDSNGTTVLGTATVDGSGNWSVSSSTLSVGSHTLTATQTDAAGNLSTLSAGLALTIQTPVVPTPVVDGVPVTTLAVFLPGGNLGTQTSVPIVGTARSETSGNAGVADIPLVKANGATLLLSQLPVGFGLSASGINQSASTSGQELIAAILASTPGHTSGDQGHLTGNGTSFLNGLASSTPLVVETIVPATDANAQAGVLTLTGTSGSAQRTALVIDTTHMGASSNLALDAVDFAAIVGAANVSGGTSGQVLTGDAAAQNFTVASSAGGAVFSGGGNDSLALGSGTSAGTSTLLHGGLDTDTAAFSGNRADYVVDAHQGYLVVTPTAQSTQHAVLINVEAVRFADASVAVSNSDALTSVAGLYQTVLGRQADYTGIDFWGSVQQSGASLGQIALGIVGAGEAQGAHGGSFNGNATHDVELLYQALYGRHSDAGGLGFWTDAMAHGTTLDQVAQALLTQLEGQQHKLGALQWDFLV